MKNVIVTDQVTLPSEDVAWLQAFGAHGLPTVSRIVEENRAPDLLRRLNGACRHIFSIINNTVVAPEEEPACDEAAKCFRIEQNRIHSVLEEWFEMISEEALQADSVMKSKVSQAKNERIQKEESRRLNDAASGPLQAGNGAGQ